MRVVVSECAWVVLVSVVFVCLLWMRWVTIWWKRSQVWVLLWLRGQGRPSTFFFGGGVFMSSMLLLIRRFSVVLYSAGSGVNRVHMLSFLC